MLNKVQGKVTIVEKFKIQKVKVRLSVKNNFGEN